jgi:ribosomal protein L40E
MVVYCAKCGAKNEDDADFCAGCGQSMGARPTVKRKQGGECFGSGKEEQECFGLPHGGAIFGIMIGVVIIAVGASLVLSEFFDITVDVWDSLWPFMIIIVGVLIVAGIVYQMTNRS